MAGENNLKIDVPSISDGIGTPAIWSMVGARSMFNTILSTLKTNNKWKMVLICIFWYMWPNTTKGTSCLLLRKLRCLHYLTGYLTSFTKCDFPFIFFIVYTLFCSLSQNKPGRQDVLFVVLGHICIFWYIHMFEAQGISVVIICQM